jgi:two-component system, OmpR family, sensor histidine kinase CiaH
MIKKLRRKFILMTMILVSAVLLIVFGVLAVYTARNLAAQSETLLRDALAREDGAAFPHIRIGPREPRDTFAMAAFFIATVDGAGEAGAITGGNVQADTELAAAAVKAALAEEAGSGVLPGLGLRYVISSGPEGMRIAFADTSGENESMRKLLLSSLVVGLLGLAGFFAVSVFLSGWAVRPVQKAWERQRQFIADASHELKTPLTVILANAGILLAHPEETIRAQAKWVENTREEAVRMKTLVDDMLFLAKSDAARAPEPQKPVSLSDILWSAFLPFESLAYEQHITLASDIAPNLQVKGDEGQLRQLAAILLDNACKYAGENGHVSVTLDRARDKARLTFRNGGEPIPAEHLPYIFERFYRADASRARDKGGYGLGLAIALSIVQAHRGEIHAESSLEKGTVFTVLLPMKA